MLSEIGQNVKDARAAYRRFVEGGMQEPSPLDSAVSVPRKSSLSRSKELLEFRVVA